MKTLTIINTVLSSILIPILFSSILSPHDSLPLQQHERVVCDNPHNASSIIVEDNAPVVLDDSFQKAIEAMRSKGYKVMASFLESQLLGSDMREYSNAAFFVFAPPDEAVARAKVDSFELSFILLRHISSGRLSLRSDGFDLFRTFLHGFVVIKSRELFNCEVPVESCPILYQDFDRRLYVYGLPKILSPLMVEEVSKRRGGLLEPCVR